MSRFKKLSKIAKLIGATTATGLVAGRMAAGYTASANGRKAAKREGTAVGGIIGASAGLAPVLGKLVFRRIRGRIIPIRVK